MEVLLQAAWEVFVTKVTIFKGRKHYNGTNEWRTRLNRKQNSKTDKATSYKEFRREKKREERKLEKKSKENLGRFKTD